jgi:hypothetical protein
MLSSGSFLCVQNLDPVIKHIMQRPLKGDLGSPAKLALGTGA